MNVDWECCWWTSPHSLLILTTKMMEDFNELQGGDEGDVLL